MTEMQKERSDLVREIAVKKTTLAVTLVFVLTLISGAKAAQFDYSQFEGWSYDPPIVTLASPQNTTYNVPDVPLNVTVQIRGWILKNIELIRLLNYSLDGQTAIPLTLIVPSMYDISELPYPVYGNDILTGLSDGSHNLTIFGETSIGGSNAYFNETVSFTVDTSNTPEPPEPFPTSLIIASVITVAVSVGLLVYFKKRKR